MVHVPAATPQVVVTSVVRPVGMMTYNMVSAGLKLAPSVKGVDIVRVICEKSKSVILSSLLTEKVVIDASVYVKVVETCSFTKFSLV
jgi:hypothetical protein